MSTIARYFKAVVAFAGAAATFLTANGFPAEGKWLSGAVAAVTAFVVLLVPNAKKAAKSERY